MIVKALVHAPVYFRLSARRAADTATQIETFMLSGHW
jgi:hypothetical protein